MHAFGNLLFLPLIALTEKILLQDPYEGKAVVWILYQGIWSQIFLDMSHGIKFPIHFLTVSCFCNCRAMESSNPPKLRRNASASANISNLASQGPANPGLHKFLASLRMFFKKKLNK